MHSRIVDTVLFAGLLALPACSSAPPYQGMTVDDVYELGRQKFEEEDWSKAAEILRDAVIRAAPGWELEPDARLMTAQAYFNDEMYLTAQDEYTRFLGRFQNHPMAGQASLGVCESFAALSPIPPRDQQYTRQAELVCQNVALDYASRDPEVAARAEELANLARGRLAEKEYDNGAYYASREWYDSAIIYYQVVVDDYGDTVWAPRAILGIIEAYQEIGYDDEVEEWRQTLLNSYPDSPEARSIVNGGSGDRPPLP